MLKRLYANNYRCLVNFEFNFDELSLLVGPNGGGKSTLFDLLYKIRHLIVDNAKVSEVFPPEDITAWSNKSEQSFELDVQGKDGLFSYKLIISHNSDIKKQRIEIEHLLLDGKPLFEFKHGEVKLYHDDHKPGPEYSFDWAIAVPKRNIETWIHFLDGDAVDENTSYPKLGRERNCKPAVDRLLQLCRSTGLTPNAPQALATACDEYVLTTNKSVMPKSVN